MLLSQELDLRVSDSWQDEVRSALNGGTMEVRELHALDWTSGLLGGSLELELPARRTGQQVHLNRIPLSSWKTEPTLEMGYEP